MRPEEDELSDLYRAGSREEPPPWLDAAVLSAARNAHARRAALERSAPARWMAPFALAAVLVLSVSIALLVDETPRLGDPPARVASPDRALPAGADGVAASPPVDPAASPLNVPAPSAPPPDESASARKVEREAPRAARAPAHPAMPREAQQQAASRDGFDLTDRSAAEARAQPPVTMPPGAAKTEAATAEPASPPAQGAARAERLRPAAPRGLLEQDKARADAASELGAAAPPRRAGETAGDAAERWLREIERLRREGRDEEARAQLEAFRERYPTYVLPDALR